MVPINFCQNCDPIKQIEHFSYMFDKFLTISIVQLSNVGWKCLKQKITYHEYYSDNEQGKVVCTKVALNILKNANFGFRVYEAQYYSDNEQGMVGCKRLL